MASTPTFPSVARLKTVAVSTANTNRDGTGTIVTGIAGVAAGTRVTQVDVQWTVTSTAGMLRVFLSEDTGSTWKLFDEIAVSAITVSASVAAFRSSRFYPNLTLPATTNLIGFATHNAEASTVTVHGTDLT